MHGRGLDLNQSCLSVRLVEAPRITKLEMLNDFFFLRSILRVISRNHERITSGGQTTQNQIGPVSHSDMRFQWQTLAAEAVVVNRRRDQVSHKQIWR